MAAKCAGCGNTISTWQELSTAFSNVTKAIWKTLDRNLKEILQVILMLSGSAAGAGVAAGPLNSQNVPCPYCGDTERWVDE